MFLEKRLVLIDNLHKLSNDQVEELLVMNGYFDPVDYPHNLAQLILKFSHDINIPHSLQDLSFCASTDVTQQEKLPGELLKLIGSYIPYYHLNEFCIATHADDIYFWMDKLRDELRVTNEELEIMKITQPDIINNLDTIKRQYFTIKTGCNNRLLRPYGQVPFLLDSYFNIIDEIKGGKYLKAVKILKEHNQVTRSLFERESDSTYFSTILYYVTLLLRHKHSINLYHVLPIEFKSSPAKMDLEKFRENIVNQLFSYNRDRCTCSYSQYVYDKQDLPSLVITSQLSDIVIHGLFVGSYVIGDEVLQNKLQDYIASDSKQLLFLTFLAESIRGNLESYKTILDKLGDVYLDFTISGLNDLGLMYSLLFGHMDIVSVYLEFERTNRGSVQKVMMYFLRFLHPDKIHDILSILEKYAQDDPHFNGYNLLLYVLVDTLYFKCYDKIPYMINKVLEKYDTVKLADIIRGDDELYMIISNTVSFTVNLLANEDGTINILVYRSYKALLDLLDKLQMKKLLLYKLRFDISINSNINKPSKLLASMGIEK